MALISTAGLVACETEKTASTPDTQVHRGVYGGGIGPTPSTGAAPVAAEPAKTTTATPSKPAPMASSATVMYLPTGDRATSALMIEKIYPSEVIAGQTFDYMIKATNLTNGSLSGVNVTDSPPSNFKVASTDPKAEMSGQNMLFRLGDLAARESKTIKVTGAATGAGAVANCCSAEWSNSLCMSINVTQPALKIVKTAPAEVMACDPIPVKITVTNSGTGMARNVKVTDTLAAGLSTSDGKTGQMTLDAGTLGPGQSKDFAVSLKASKSGSYSNTASAAAEGGLTATSNSTTTVVKQPVLTIKADCGQGIMIGREATIKFTVKNTGDGVCANTSLNATIPAGATFSAADSGGTANGGTVTWNLGTIAAGDSKTVSFRCRAMKAETLTSRGTVQCTCASAVSDQCTVPVQGVPDIGTSTDDDSGVVVVGENHKFDYTVVNQGQVDLTNITVEVVLSDGLEYVSSTAVNPPTVEGKKLTFRGINALKPGERKTFSLVCKGTAAGEQGIMTTTSCAELKRTVRHDEQVTYVPR